MALVFFKGDSNTLSLQELEIMETEYELLDQQIKLLVRKRSLLRSKLQGAQCVQCGEVIEIDKGGTDDHFQYPVKCITVDGVMHYLSKGNVVKHRPLE